MPVARNVLYRQARPKIDGGQPQGELIQERRKSTAHKRARADAPQQQANRTRSLLRKHQVQPWLQEVPSEVNEKNEGGMGAGVLGA